MRLSELLPRQASLGAVRVDTVALIVMAVCTGIALAVLLVLLWFCFRYRAGSSADRASPPERNMLLEVVWITLPMLIGVGMFVLGAREYYNLFVPPAQALEIEVVGEQWLWTIRHPNGRTEINTLHLPLGVPVRLKMISQDVIHSFYLPEFRTKHDVLPGRYSYLGITPEKVGRFNLACSEYCGTDHYKMRGEVVVVTAEQYHAWGAENTPDTPQQRGRLLFGKLGCAGCHDYQSGVNVTGAPILDGIFGKTVAFEGGGSAVVDEEYIRRSILRPKAQVVAGFAPLMPTYQDQVSEHDIMDLIAYLRSRSGPQSKPILKGGERS